MVTTLAICTLLGLTAAGVAGEAGDSLVQLPLGTRYELGEERNVRVPIIPVDGVSIDGIQVEVLDAAFGARHELGLHNAFKAVLKSDQGRLPAIEVTISKEAQSRPGTFVVTLLMRDEKPTPKSQQLQLQLDRPAAQLAPLVPLRIEREIIPFFSMKSVNQILVLRETSNKTPLTSITVRPITSAAADGSPADLRLNATVPLIINPGQAAETAYEVAGEGPLGIVNGQYEVYAPELTAPVAGTFQVVTRLHKATLICVIVVGLVLGYLVRTYLQSIIGSRQLILQTRPVLRAAVNGLNTIKDPIFHSGVQPAVTALNAAVYNKQYDQIAEKLTDLRTTFERQSVTHTQREADCNARIAALKHVLLGSYDVEPPLPTILKLALNRLAVIQDGLNQDRNVVIAEEAFAIAAAETAQSIYQAASAWSQNMQREIDEFGAVIIRLAETIRNRWTEQEQSLRTELKEINIATLTPKIEEILTKLHYARQNLGLAVNVAVSQMISLVRGLAFDDEMLRHPKDLDDLKCIMARLRTAPANDLIAASVLLEQSWKQSLQLILSQFEESSQEHGELQDLLAQGRFEQAVVRLFELLRQPVLAQSLAADEMNAKTGHPNGAKRIDVSPEPIIVGSRPPVVSDSPIIRVSTTERLPAQIDVEAHSFREIAWAKLVQTSVAGVLTAFVGFLVFAPNFVGTAAELTAALLWGFFMDVGIDQLAGISKLLRRAE